MLKTDVTHSLPKKRIIPRWIKKKPNSTDYLICNRGFATATSLSAMLDGEVGHLCP